jgi:hypothetical protein
LVFFKSTRGSPGVVGPSEPNDLSAQSLAAGENLDPYALVGVQPDADRRFALCSGRRRGKQRNEHPF